MKKRFNRPNLDSSANSSRSGSVQSSGQYLGRERGLDFSSLKLHISKYNLTGVKMFQNKFGLDDENKQEWDSILERQITKLDPKDARLSMVCNPVCLRRRNQFNRSWPEMTRLYTDIYTSQHQLQRTEKHIRLNIIIQC